MTTIDKKFEWDTYSEQCTICQHLITDENKTCLAFPEGIPKDIWNADKKHTEVVEGQEGDYVFKENE